MRTAYRNYSRQRKDRMSTECLAETYSLATPDQIARGRAWYDTYRAACDEIAAEHETPLDAVVATACITSADAQLAANVGWTRRAVASGGAEAAGRYPNTMQARYAPILDGSVPPEDGLGNGPKVRAFYRAILGDPDAVVLDRWALRAAGHHRDTATPKQYQRIADEYRAAAAAVGERPRDFQAIVWIVTRESAVRADGRPQAPMQPPPQQAPYPPQQGYPPQQQQQQYPPQQGYPPQGGAPPPQQPPPPRRLKRS